MKKQPQTLKGRTVLMASAALFALSTVTGPLLAPARAESTMPIQEQMLHSYADIVEAAKPAVVTITTTADMQPQMMAGPGGPGQGMPMDPFFRQFFGENSPFGQQMPQQMPPQTMPRRAQPVRALGSGFIVSPDGYIVTNNHVIDGAKSIKVTLDDGTEYDGTLIGRDAKTDLAVIRIEAGTELPTVAWGDSDMLRIGDPIVAIGNPFGVGTTVTSGIVSARGRDIHSGPYDDFIQVDAAINHGNSGGPLLDAQGLVVGVNAAIFSPNDGNVGVGFAIPSDQAQAIVDRLISDGSIERGYLGVQIQPVTEDLADAMGFDKAEGAIVASVQPDTPAAAAGIRSGDVILAVNGNAVADAKALSRRVADLAPGQSQSFEIWRDGSTMSLDVTLAALPADDQAQVVPASADGSEILPDLGLNLMAITPDVRMQYGLSNDVAGILVTDVAPDGSAAETGLRPGDIITAVNMEEVRTVNDVAQAVSMAEKDGRGAVLFKVERDGSARFVGVPVKAA